jgi:hemolysin activation/secretion protein
VSHQGLRDGSPLTARLTLVVWLTLVVCLVLMAAPNAWGQVTPLPPRLEPTPEPPPIFREEPRPAPPPSPILPPVPAPLLERELTPTVRVFIREIRVVGSTVFSPEELGRVTAPYTNREVTAEDLETLRIALTRLYVDRGYINSGALLPDQSVTEGIVTYDIIEGQLTGINVGGNRWFRRGYLERRLALGAGPPLNVNTLQERFQLLLQDQRIERLNADLKPGVRLGEALLDVQVEERFPLRLWLDFNNYQSPSVGAERGILGLEHQNLTGNGDILTLQYGRSDGLDPLLDFKYSLPFTARDTTAIFQYRRNSFTVVEEPFTELDIETKSEIFTLGLRQPVYRTRNTEITLEFIGERLSQETFVLGEPFSLEPGARHGESVVTALRAGQEFVYRTPNQVIAARSRFSFGLDALGSTIHDDNSPDSRFFAWLGQFQLVRRLDFLPFLFRDTQLIARSDLQVSDDPLLVLEQIAVGGRYTVRGYRENTLVRDNAFLASLEARVPLISNVPWADYLQLAPFFDYGRAWNTERDTPDPADISSVGIGLRWGASIRSPVPVRTDLEFYWGYALRNVKTPGGDPQDDGLHFRFVLTFF